MTQAAVRLVAILALPLAGLAWLWTTSDHLSRQGTDWEVEIQGFDPRDLLRGHYVEFRYDWPIAEVSEQEPGRFRPAPYALCLIGEAPGIREAVVIEPGDGDALEACEHKLIADPASVYGIGGLSVGRLYVGQDRARAIEDEMRDFDQRGIVTFRQRDDGVLTPLDIRFRPLTPEEIIERDGVDVAEQADSGQ